MSRLVQYSSGRITSGYYPVDRVGNYSSDNWYPMTLPDNIGHEIHGMDFTV